MNLVIKEMLFPAKMLRRIFYTINAIIRQEHKDTIHKLNAKILLPALVTSYNLSKWSHTNMHTYTLTLWLFSR